MIHYNPKEISMSQENLALDFVLIPAGDFLMGSDSDRDRQAQSDEQPQHTLSVSN